MAKRLTLTRALHIEQSHAYRKLASDTDRKTAPPGGLRAGQMSLSVMQRLVRRRIVKLAKLQDLNSKSMAVRRIRTYILSISPGVSPRFFLVGLFKPSGGRS
jgi:hypothetical protein